MSHPHSRSRNTGRLWPINREPRAVRLLDLEVWRAAGGMALARSTLGKKGSLVKT